eukprot:augustus_masked-scaffold_54-processed-gene-0.30-mRNA-1 protein AED:1.00 eAED:1.00 QI:0/-1/0/0/-1/1/1/0/579
MKRKSYANLDPFQTQLTSATKSRRAAFDDALYSVREFLRSKNFRDLKQLDVPTGKGVTDMLWFIFDQLLPGIVARKQQKNALHDVISEFSIEPKPTRMQLGAASAKQNFRKIVAYMANLCRLVKRKEKLKPHRKTSDVDSGFEKDQIQACLYRESIREGGNVQKVLTKWTLKSHRVKEEVEKAIIMKNKELESAETKLKQLIEKNKSPDILKAEIIKIAEKKKEYELIHKKGLLSLVKVEEQIDQVKQQEQKLKEEMEDIRREIEKDRKRVKEQKNYSREEIQEMSSNNEKVLTVKVAEMLEDNDRFDNNLEQKALELSSEAEECVRGIKLIRQKIQELHIPKKKQYSQFSLKETNGFVDFVNLRKSFEDRKSLFARFKTLLLQLDRPREIFLPWEKRLKKALNNYISELENECLECKLEKSKLFNVDSPNRSKLDKLTKEVERTEGQLKEVCEDYSNKKVISRSLDKDIETKTMDQRNLLKKDRQTLAMKKSMLGSTEEALLTAHRKKEEVIVNGEKLLREQVEELNVLDREMEMVMEKASRNFESACTHLMKKMDDMLDYRKLDSKCIGQMCKLPEM